MRLARGLLLLRYEMRQTLWVAVAVLLGLALYGQKAFAGDYGSDFYAGADIYVARAHAPIYDCPRPGCRTDIRLRAGSSIYAICWDGGEGWCKVQTRYFKNMFLPRYALDLADGGHRYKVYSYSESYPHESYPHKYHSYNNCYYKDRYYHHGSYREGCYDKYSESYKEHDYKYSSHASEYVYTPSYRSHGYRHDDYDNDEYRGE
jgi:hypothetical protein